MLVPTIILCFVSSTFACEAYTNASAYFKSSNTFLKDALSWETPTESDANYAALLLTMVGISYLAGNGLSYDDAYNQYPGLVFFGEKFPTQARDSLLAVMAVAENDTLSIRKLVEETCRSEVSEDCDCKVEDAIKDDAKLQAQAALTVEFVTADWAGFHDAWQAAADSNTVSDYLAANKKELQAHIDAKAFKQMEDIEADGYSG